MNYTLPAQQQTYLHTSGDNIMETSKYTNYTNPQSNLRNQITLKFIVALPGLQSKLLVSLRLLNVKYKKMAEVLPRVYLHSSMATSHGWQLS
jgi:hypothetical protein